MRCECCDDILLHALGESSLDIKLNEQMCVNLYIIVYEYIMNIACECI